MKFRRNLSNSLLRSVAVLAALILFCCIRATMLFAEAASGPVQLDLSPAQFPNVSAATKIKLTYKIIDAPNRTFGYDVFADGRLAFHQTCVPALPGNEGFVTKEDATKVALLAIEKIKKGEMPPTISIDEMKALNVIP